MKPAVYDLTIYCGTTVDAGTLTFTYKVNGVAVNLTGYSARSQARDADDGLIFDLTSVNGGITLGGAAGTISLSLDAQATSALWTGDGAIDSAASGAALYDRGVWDLELIAPNGRVQRLIQGRLLLSPEVTR